LIRIKNQARDFLYLGRDIVAGKAIMNLPTVGHNTADITIKIELKLFNSLARHLGAPLEPQTLHLPAGSTLGDLLRQIEMPPPRVFIAYVNGRDITPRVDGGIETEHPLQDSDVVALSGPVPYSWGYGSPIV